MFKPEGVYVAMMTPFAEDGSLNEEELRRMIDFQIQNGVHGLFPVSTVGEFIHLTFEAKVKMMEITVDQSKGMVPVTPGVAASHPDDSIRLAHQASKLGCKAVVIAPPHYYPHSPDSIEAFFQTIIQSVEIPIILYNIPLFAQPLTYDVIRRLAESDKVVGIKDSSGSMVDMMHFMDESSYAGNDLNLLTGREETLFALLMSGGKGCMATSAGIVPEVMTAIYNSYVNKDYDQALRMQQSICPLVRAMFLPPFPLGFKYAMELRGFKMGPPKLPLSEAQLSGFESAKSTIQESLGNILSKYKIDS
ncbi:MAG: dihydrodipicolinate synthase family protein [Proteobacteria bacterium]|nr:dihydrodipicolinate synthase family protein [Pseudomonadota bacterium]